MQEYENGSVEKKKCWHQKWLDIDIVMEYINFAVREKAKSFS